MTKAQLSAIIALALYIPAPLLAARSDWGADNPGGAGNTSPAGSADSNARFAFQAQTQIREASDRARDARCGCNSTDPQNGHGGRIGL